MELFLTILSLAAWAVCSAFAALRWVHMLQLNSYRLSTQCRWMKTHPQKLLCLFVPLLALVFSCFDGPVLRILCAAFALLSLAALFPRKAKKPLVFTGRVKRLLAMYALLSLLGLLAASLLGGKRMLVIPFALLTASPLLTLLAALLCDPFEAAVRRYYIRDAQSKLRSCPNLLIVGVTGSYGKTSVKSYLGQLLSVQFDTLITPESYNTPMGVVRTVRERLGATHEVFVCEMGARHVGDIRELCELVHPVHGIITAVGNQHLETFHTPEAIRNTKYELSDALPPDGILLVNGDCEQITGKPPSHAYLTYGTHPNCDYRAQDIQVTTHGTTFTAVTPDGERYTFRMPLIGTHSVQNVMGAIAFCHRLGIPLPMLAPAVQKLQAVPHRMQLIQGGDVTFLDDAYNSNPQGCRAALETLARFDACRILVTPGMVELGEAMEQCNEQFGAQAASVCDFCVLVGEKQAVPIRRGLLREQFPEERILVVRTVQEAIAAARAFRSDKPKKVILLENDLPDNY